jgi:hypothetical protein
MSMPQQSQTMSRITCSFWVATTSRLLTKRREDRLTIRELSSLRRPTEQLIERLNCRGHAGGGWASAATDCLSRQSLRRSSRLTSRNLGEPVNNRPFTLLLGSTSCENRPARRASFVKPIKSATYADELVLCGVNCCSPAVYGCTSRTGRCPQLALFLSGPW